MSSTGSDHFPPRVTLLVVLGPTASGKTDLSLELGARLQGEIIGADSRQIYRNMDIGTAKPTPEQRARLPHHLIDIVGPDQVFTAAEWQENALNAVSAIHARGRLPIVVGGTGQYLVGLLNGWSGPRVKANPELRQSLEAEREAVGPVALHQRLHALDPAAASRIDPRNSRRVIRALEVIMLTGEPFSAQRRQIPTAFHTVILGLRLPRERLYARADRRIDSMMESGLLDEVDRLLARGYSRTLPSMSGIGYQQLAAHRLDGVPLGQAIIEMRRATRRFIRHQDTWFRQLGERIRWVDPEALAVPELARQLAEQLEKVSKA